MILYYVVVALLKSEDEALTEILAPGVIKKEVTAPPKPVVFETPSVAPPDESGVNSVSQGQQVISTPVEEVVTVKTEERSFQELFDEVMQKRNNFYAREATALAFSKGKKVCIGGESFGG